ncbi:MAG TPA: hypothetical protein VFH80_00010 [Solirubrobacteraceae bacterium]|nr:hypothetical protein [Solirubrobacteraceae bacterium]
MPTDKDFKRIVRQRMADTGERFTEARAALSVEPDPPQVSIRQTGRAETPPITGRWIEMLGDPQQNQGAFGRLKALPPEQLTPLAVAGTRHADPRVRRRSCQLLDDLALTDETVAALEACAVDPEPKVRRAALHTLSCEHCKPDGVCLDQRMVAERAARDRSATVRRGIAMTLAWNPKHSDGWAVAMATRFLEDPSAEIRRHAQAALGRIELQRSTDAERRQLPEPLRTKTERHPGRWVAVVDGRIVAVDPPPSWRRRNPSVRLYFVAPSGGSDDRP